MHHFSHYCKFQKTNDNQISVKPAQVVDILWLDRSHVFFFSFPRTDLNNFSFMLNNWIIIDDVWIYWKNWNQTLKPFKVSLALDMLEIVSEFS